MKKVESFFFPSLLDDREAMHFSFQRISRGDTSFSHASRDSLGLLHRASP